MVMQRVRVSGNCAQSVEEDLCVRVEVDVKRVVFAPDATHITVELKECSTVPCAVLISWSRIEIFHDGKIFVLDHLVTANELMEAKPVIGFNFYQEPQLALVFKPVVSRLN